MRKSALQTSEVLHMSMNAQLTYEPIVNCNEQLDTYTPIAREQNK